MLMIENVTYLGTRTASAWQFSSGWSSHSSCGTFCTCIRTSSRQICSPCCMAQLLGTQTSRGIFRHSVSGWTFRTVFLPNVHFWTGHSSQFSSTYELRVENSSIFIIKIKSLRSLNHNRKVTLYFDYLQLPTTNILLTHPRRYVQIFNKWK